MFCVIRNHHNDDKNFACHFFVSVLFKVVCVSVCVKVYAWVDKDTYVLKKYLQSTYYENNTLAGTFIVEIQA